MAKIVGQRLLDLRISAGRLQAANQRLVIGDRGRTKPRLPLAQQLAPHGGRGTRSRQIRAQIALLQADGAAEVERIHLGQRPFDRPAIVLQAEQGRDRAGAMPSPLTMDGDRQVGRVVEQFEELLELPRREPRPAFLFAHRPLQGPGAKLGDVIRLSPAVGFARIETAPVQAEVVKLQAEHRANPAAPDEIPDSEFARLTGAVERPFAHGLEALELSVPEDEIAAAADPDRQQQA
jgi:hypothetical protein